MTLDLVAVPLGFLSGILGVMSPCVWPLVPVVMASAVSEGRSGPYYLASGMGLSFAVAGTILSWLLVSAGLDPELFRYVAAGFIVAIAVVLLVRPLGEWLTLRLSSLSRAFGDGAIRVGVSPRGQFGIGALLGIVWLPCVGPTLGAAIALASVGQSLPMAFVVMLAYGVGTAGVLLVAALLSARVLARRRPDFARGARWGRRVLGGSLLFLGVLVFSGFDKVLERAAVDLLPGWVFTF